MYFLARREKGGLARVYAVDAPLAGPFIREFFPVLGHGSTGFDGEDMQTPVPEPSRLCRPGVIACARTKGQALELLHNHFPENYA